MKPSLHSKVQTLALDSGNLLTNIRDFADILNPEINPELTEITRQISELGHSTRMKSPDFARLQYIKNIRLKISELLESTQKRHARISQAANYRSMGYGRIQYTIDSVSHLMGTADFTSQVLLLKRQIPDTRD